MNDKWAKLQEDAERSLVNSGAGDEGYAAQQETLTVTPASVVGAATNKLDNQRHIVTRTTGDQDAMMSRAVNLMQMRSDIHSNRFYKKSSRVTSTVQQATVVDDSTSFYSSRVKKRQRKNNVLEQLIGDIDTTGSRKRADSVRAKSVRGGKNAYKRKQQKRQSLQNQKLKDLKVLFKFGGYK